MNFKGIKLFRILGIQISLDWTWFIVFFLFSWSLAYGYYPRLYPGLQDQVYIFMGVVSALLLFACVLIHELSHSYTANRLGLDISEITLFIFGGVAQLTKEPEDAKTELKIAVAGPAASLVLAVLFWFGSRLFEREIFPVTHAILIYIALINMVLLVFNMIPGFPLDGGRVLRALWWVKTGDLTSATRAASQIGRGFAFALILFGFFQIMVGNFIGGLWGILIGIFLQQAAASGYQQLLVKMALEGVRVRDVMSKGVVSIRADIPLSKAVEDFFFRFHFASFPVTSDGTVSGILTLGNVRGVDKSLWDTTLVRDAMFALGPEDFLSPEDTAYDAIVKISGKGIGRLPVVQNGALVGILSRSDIVKLMEFKALLRG